MSICFARSSTTIITSTTSAPIDMSFVSFDLRCLLK